MKKFEISKELLDALFNAENISWLSYNVVNITYKGISQNTPYLKVHFSKINKQELYVPTLFYKLFSLDEFEKMLKVWAYKQGSEWMIVSWDDCSISGIADFKNQSSNEISRYKTVYSHNDRLTAKLRFQKESELEAIIAACEWLKIYLDIKDKKC